MSLISGNVTFNSGSINYSANANVIIGESNFCGDAQNCGLISSGNFFDVSINAGIISCKAIFAESSVNNGTASVAIFSGNAINCSSVTTCAVFLDTAINAGSVACASFCESAMNNGIVSQSASFLGTAVNCGSICGNAVFLDTAINDVSAVICGNADFSAGACNLGSVIGQVGTYWYGDGSALTRPIFLNGNVTQVDEGSGVKVASFNEVGATLVGDMIDLHGGYATVEGFYYIEDISDGTIINFGTGSSPIGYHLTFIADGTIWVSNGVSTSYSTSIPYQANAWTYWAFVFNTTHIKIYKNGIYINTFALPIHTGANKFSLGNYFGNASTPFIGKIAGLRVTNTEVYTQNFAVPTSLLTAITGTQLLLNFEATAVPIAVINIKNGAYSDGYFLNDVLDTSYDSSTPVQAQDDSKWYTYASGVATAASGAYSNGYYAAGELNNAGDTSIPTDAAQDDSKWYTYASGVATAASGAYSNGYYAAGELSGTYTTPVQAQDDSKWYTYASSVATAASGYYSNGYYVSGEISSAGDTLSAVQAQDNSLYYTYSSGIATLFNAPAFTTDLSTMTQYYTIGEQVTLTVEASNATSYQWYHGVSAGSTYQLSNVESLVSGVDTNSMTFIVDADLGGGAKLGNYIHVVATNLAGSTSSFELHWIGYPALGTVLSTETNYITINGNQYSNGTYDVIADGSGGTTNGNYQYASVGTEFYNDSVTSYQSDGNGGYTEVPV